MGIMRIIESLTMPLQRSSDAPVRLKGKYGIDSYQQIDTNYKHIMPGETQDFRVNFSQTSKDFQLAKAYVDDAPDIRWDKVESLKEQIATDTYYVPYEKTAEKMLGAFMYEI
jgi:negative regulator of flagellin synthesis FlgM